MAKSKKPDLSNEPRILVILPGRKAADVKAAADNIATSLGGGAVARAMKRRWRNAKGAEISASDAKGLEGAQVEWV